MPQDAKRTAESGMRDREMRVQRESSTVRGFGFGVLVLPVQFVPSVGVADGFAH